jgi:hypothetical protein
LMGPISRCSAAGCNHAFVNRFIVLPKFSLAPVEVDCHEFHSASGSGSTRVRIPQPPSPPGLLGPDPGRFGPFPALPSGGMGRGLTFVPRRRSIPDGSSYDFRRTLPEVMPPVSDMTQEGFSVSGARWTRYANGARPARGDRANLA